MEKVFKIFLVPIAIIFLISAYTFISFRTYEQVVHESNMRMNSFGILTSLRIYLISVLEIEIQKEEYTGGINENTYDRYLLLKNKISRELYNLRTQYTFTPSKTSLDTLESLSNSMFITTDSIIESHRLNNATAEISKGLWKNVRKIVDSIRREVQSLLEVEEVALFQSDFDLKTNVNTLFLVVLSTSIIIILIAYIFSAMVLFRTKNRLLNLSKIKDNNIREIQKENSLELQTFYRSLQISEEKLSVTLNSIGDAVLATDSRGRVTLLNPMAEKLTGWNRLDALSRPMEEIFHIINPETRLSTTISMKEALKDGNRGLANHTLLISRDGTEKAIADSYAPIRDRDNQPVGAVLVFRDVTDSYKKEAQIRQLIEEQQTILDCSLTMIYYKDKDNRFVRVNNSMAKLNGKSKDEMEGKTCWYLYPKELAENYWMDDQEVMNSGIPKINIEEYMKTPSGLKIIQTDKFPYRNSQNEVIGIIGFSKDITDIRKIDEDYKKLAAIVESAEDAIIGKDAQGYIISWNKGAESMYGYKSEEVLGKHFTKTLVLEDRETDMEVVALRTNSHQKNNYETLRRKKDGKCINVSLTISPVKNIRGEIVGTSTIAHDITKRIKAEAGLLKAYRDMELLTEKLKETAKVKSEFMASMSHELRTPLNSINGFSEILYDESFGELNAKQKKYVHNIYTSGKSLLLIINQILEMAVVEAGKMILTISKIDIKALLNEVLMVLDNMMVKKNLHFKLTIPELLPVLEGDELKVKEVLFNLISNAVKYTPDNKNIGVNMEIIERNIVIEIWDEGIGIAPEDMEKIFEGFYRVDSSYTRTIEGTGLGLSLTRKIVELHGGVVSVESEGPGLGTSVKFTLPLFD